MKYYNVIYNLLSYVWTGGMQKRRIFESFMSPDLLNRSSVKLTNPSILTAQLGKSVSWFASMHNRWPRLQIKPPFVPVNLELHANLNFALLTQASKSVEAHYYVHWILNLNLTEELGFSEIWMFMSTINVILHRQIEKFITLFCALTMNLHRVLPYKHLHSYN